MLSQKEGENDAASIDESSPRYMTPTIASKRAQYEKLHKTNETPETFKRGKWDKSDALLKSAAKRVGLSRTKDMAPRSKKKNHPLSQTQAIPFPDKLDTGSYAKLPESPHAQRDTHRSKLSESPLNKPLPNAPVAPYSTASPTNSSVSLIDATDKPLRGFRGTDSSGSETEWPVLQPKRVDSPRTIQQMMQETGQQLRKQSVSSPEERYPKLGGSHQFSAKPPVFPMSQYSTKHSITRQTAATPSAVSVSDTEHQSSPATSSDPFGQSVSTVEGEPDALENPMPAQQLTAGAAAVEKSFNESKSSLEPRQTRTSSLRERLSTGRLVKDAQSKVVGFTDFTTPVASTNGAARQNSYKARKAAQARQADDNGTFIPRPVQHRNSHADLRAKASAESLDRTRAPARMVAGSRRSLPALRPSSRASTRCFESEATSGRLPGRPATYAISKDRMTTTDGPRTSIERKILSSKTSIPVPCTTAIKTDKRAVPGGVLAQNLNKANTIPQRKAYVKPGFHQEKPFGSTIKKVDVAPPNNLFNRQSALFSDHEDDQHGLEAIEESPLHSVKSRQLSTKAPSFGPILKISPHADRFIMGPRLDQENIPDVKGNDPSLQRSISSANSQDSSLAQQIAGNVIQKRPDRPLSSNGSLRTPSRNVADLKTRERKAKSADLSSIASETFVSASSSARKLSNTSKETKTSLNNDPFFEASDQPVEYIGSEMPKTSSTGVEPQATQDFADGQPDVVLEVQEVRLSESLKGKLDGVDAPDTGLDHHVSVEKLNSPRDSNQKAQQHSRPLSKDTLADFVTRYDEESDQAGGDTIVDSQASAAFGSSSGHTNAYQAIAPSLGEQSRVIKQSGTSLTTHGPLLFPPRSSSRQIGHTFTSTEGAPDSTMNGNQGSSLPHEQYSVPMEKSGPVRKYSDLIGDANGLGPASITKRISVAQSSANTQQSATKTAFKSIRGLFHKDDPKSNSKKPAIKGPRISVNGSPHSAINGQRPAHRRIIGSTSRVSLRPKKTNTPEAFPQGKQVSAGSSNHFTPTLLSPVPNDLSTTTSLTMQILEAARNESSSPKKEKLLEMGKIMVDAITHARDAEKAMEEAHMAAKRAEMANELCQKALRDVSSAVTDWKAEA